MFCFIVERPFFVFLFLIFKITTSFFSLKKFMRSFEKLKGSTKPAAIAIVCFCFCELRTVSYSGSCVELVTDFSQSTLVVLLPLR